MVVQRNTTGNIYRHREQLPQEENQAGRISGNHGCRIARQGKNWYCEIENIRIAVNAYSYTIITAHTIQ